MPMALLLSSSIIFATTYEPTAMPPVRWTNNINGYVMYRISQQIDTMSTVDKGFKENNVI
jgi:hypothetical protein